jgi:hypothetical protein
MHLSAGPEVGLNSVVAVSARVPLSLDRDERFVAVTG